MNADKRRILLVLGVLALIAVFVVGAIELATNDKPAEKPAEPPVAQPADDKSADQPVSGAVSDNGSTSSTATTSPDAPSAGGELPRTGPDALVVAAALTLLILSGIAYQRSRRELASNMLNLR